MIMYVSTHVLYIAMLGQTIVGVIIDLAWKARLLVRPECEQTS